MSDFLHNLRTGNLKPRYDRPRKNYDNPQHRNQNDRNFGKDRKGNYQKKVHTGDQLQEIKKHLESIAQTVESNFKAQEKAAVALERIAAVLEAATGIKADAATIEAAGATVRDESPAQTAAEPQATPEPAKNPETPTLSKDVLLATITEMRNDGVSFEKIAAELEKRGIPTVSGRGKWRGPAVSKLLKETA